MKKSKLYESMFQNLNKNSNFRLESIFGHFSRKKQVSTKYTLESENGYFDVDDGCWWRIWDTGERFFEL